MQYLPVPAQTEQLSAVQDFLEDLLIQNDCPPKTQLQVGLVAEEVFVNIAHYAYPDTPGDAMVGAQIDGDPPVLTLRFSDRGVPFDPLAHPETDTTLPADKRPMGGLGILLTRRLVDKAEYSYQNGQNILTLQKKL